MRRFFFITASVIATLLSLSANAQPFVLATADMRVSEGRHDFENLSTVNVILLADDGITPSHIALDYGISSVILVIDPSVSETDDDGCINFHGYLDTGYSDNTDAHRFHVMLASDYGCRSLGREWHGYASEGYGWCGTMDSTMRFTGYPQWRDAR